MPEADVFWGTCWGSVEEMGISIVMGGTPKQMVYKGKSLFKWMILGYPHFRKPPNISPWSIFLELSMIPMALWFWWLAAESPTACMAWLK